MISPMNIQNKFTLKRTVHCIVQQEAQYQILSSNKYFPLPNIAQIEATQKFSSFEGKRKNLAK